MNALTFTAITCGTTGFALWLQRRYVLYNRLTSVLLVAIMGYTAGSFKLVEVSSANLAWVVKYLALHTCQRTDGFNKFLYCRAYFSSHARN